VDFGLKRENETPYNEKGDIETSPFLVKFYFKISVLLGDIWQPIPRNKASKPWNPAEPVLWNTSRKD
jgi:hypothetical protein